MNTINWKQKLSSRKLWVGAALVIMGAVMCVTGDTASGMKLIGMGAVGYLGAEAVVDVARAIFPVGKEIEYEVEAMLEDEAI